MSAVSKVMAKALRKESGSIDPRVLGVGGMVGGGAYGGYKIKQKVNEAREDRAARMRAAEKKAAGEEDKEGE